MDNERIKKFKDFNVDKPYYKMLNRLVVTGEYKPGFFSKKKKFQIEFYYTPLKGKIMEILPTNIESFYYDFKRGDNISVVRDWIEKNKYEIVIDRKKI